jgi:DNA primase
MHINLLALIGRDTQLRRAAATNGGEYAGPCPFCRRGTDRFRVWPRHERWACLGPSAGRCGCDLWGDAIQYLRQRDGLSYREACERLNIPVASYIARRHDKAPQPPEVQVMTAAPGLVPPNARWQAHGRGWVARCAVFLWRPAGAKALDYLRGRGLTSDTLRRFNVGFNPQQLVEEHAEWGLPTPEDPAKRIHLPRGITLPWVSGGALWRINVRRPVTAAQIAAGQPKYLGPAGFANALFNADSLGVYKPVVLVEGEIDALTVAQACGDTIAAVATGSTAGARRQEWIDRLNQAPCVLVAFDHDENGAGDKAAAWWLTTLPNARRWLPLTHDVNSSPQPLDVQRWVYQGLAHSGVKRNMERNSSCSN